MLAPVVAVVYIMTAAFSRIRLSEAAHAEFRFCMLRQAQAAARSAIVRCDEDRCYYGAIDADGNVLEEDVNVKRGEILKPSPSLTPIEMIDAQFEALRRGEGAIEDAFAFVSPKVVEQYGVDLERFTQILGGYQFEGLLGCASWKVLDTSEQTEDKQLVTLQVLPKPIPGCVKASGVADQGGITWPARYVWHLERQTEGPLAGCWMLEQMAIAPPPVDLTSADGGAPHIAQTVLSD